MQMILELEKWYNVASDLYKAMCYRKITVLMICVSNVIMRYVIMVKRTNILLNESW